MQIDVVEEVRKGRARFEWATVERKWRENSLLISVQRDAMKFDDVPAMTWDWKPTKRWDEKKRSLSEDERIFNGVRLPFTAKQLQEAGDLLQAMLIPPIVLEEIWLQAKRRINAVYNTPNPIPGGPRIIVAVSDIHRYHMALEKAFAELGEDDGKVLVAGEGKYWTLDQRQEGAVAPGTRLPAACNFAWFAKKASGGGVTNRVQCWQRPGFKHDYNHWDPSQVGRVMQKIGRLRRAGCTAVEEVWLPDVAKDPELCGLLDHRGAPLTYLRQTHDGPELGALAPLRLPELVITASPFQV